MKTLHDRSAAAARRAAALVDAVCAGDAAEPGDVAPLIAEVLESFGERDVRLDPDEVDGIVAVSGRLRAVFVAADRDTAAALLNELLAQFAAAPRLVRHEGWDWHVHVDRADDAPWDEWLASSAALALATLLAGSPELPWGECAAAGCRRVYVHDGRGDPRRYCSSTCATRERVRRHRRSPPPPRRSDAARSVLRLGGRRALEAGGLGLVRRGPLDLGGSRIWAGSVSDSERIPAQIAGWNQLAKAPGRARTRRCQPDGVRAKARGSSSNIQRAKLRRPQAPLRARMPIAPRPALVGEHPPERRRHAVVGDEVVVDRGRVAIADHGGSSPRRRGSPPPRGAR